MTRSMGTGTGHDHTQSRRDLGHIDPGRVYSTAFTAHPLSAAPGPNK
jgi:hypothetical protein